MNAATLAPMNAVRFMCKAFDEKGEIALTQFFATSFGEDDMEPFLGQILMVAFDFAPKGWALCNGQLLSTSQYAALFALLGATYGGDGVSTFALPDLRGRVPIQFGQGASLSNYSLGQTGGSETTKLTTTNLPAHTHTLHVHNGVGDQKLPAATNTLAHVADADMYTDKKPNIALEAGTISSTGGNQPFSNIQPYLSVNFIIALEGVFPAQS